MNVTYIIPCQLSKEVADTLNKESARIYNNVLVFHWRILRKKGIWLSPYSAEKLEDALGGATILHAHSRDAAQQAFYKACKTIKGLRKAGHPKAFYPYKRKRFRTTIWKNTAIRLVGKTLLLSRARGLSPLHVRLTSNLHPYQANQFKEVRLHWNRVGKFYEWHVIIKQSHTPRQTTGSKVMAISLGDIHPATITDGQQAIVFSARELQASRHYIRQRVAKIESLQQTKHYGSLRWQRLEDRKNQFLAAQHRRLKDILHKVSQGVVQWSLNHGAIKLIIGNGDYVKGQPLIDPDLPPNLRPLFRNDLFKMIKYKAKQVGMEITWVYKGQQGDVCPNCQHVYVPAGLQYQCPQCKFEGVCPVISAANFLSMALFNESGKVYPTTILYRHPFLTGKRIREGTAHVARS